MLCLGVVALLALGFTAAGPRAAASVYNLKVVTDASPDYSDLDSLIHSATGSRQTPEEKLWALFYWNHQARRQCSPMVVHGLACTDPIRQFSDFGYTMCSTIAGVNCALWDAMGFRARYWDITNHTVPEVEYGGRWHMYDNSLSALYTLCDGVTIAGVEDIGKTQGCALSGGLQEPGHIAKRHCLTATSANGFLTGSDTARDLDQEYRCFNPNGLKYRPYYYDWDRGHRYILNLRSDESYTRYYSPQGDSPGFYVPLAGKDPDDGRFRLRGNGLRTVGPLVTSSMLAQAAQSVTGLQPVGLEGLGPVEPGVPGDAVFKLEGANVITSLRMDARFHRGTDVDVNAIALSTTNGLTWHEVWRNGEVGERSVDLTWVDEVNGSYEVLVKVTLLGKAAATDAQLKSLRFETTTMLNAKTQPRLLPGRNTVYVEAGEQLGSIVLWPDLQGENWKPYAVAHENIVSETQHPGYMGVMHAVKPDQEAYVVFRLDAPGDLKRLTYGGRLYNRAPNARIDFRHSFDGGKTWTTAYSLTDTQMPWDVIHYESVEAPPGTRSALVKYVLNGSEAGTNACSLYAVRMEVGYQPPDAGITPLAVTFNWSERQADRSLVERSHTQVVDRLPAKYVLNVGGEDVPVVNWLRVGPAAEHATGYSDGRDAGGEKFRWRWATYGANLAEGKPYTVSIPSNDNWGAGDPEGRKLTDGVVGPPMAGGVYPMYSLGWNAGQTAEVTVDLGAPQACAAFRIAAGGGWPWWDALKGEVEDEVEVLTSLDGAQYASCGRVDMNPWRKDLPINHLLPDDESLTAYLFTLALPEPVQARHVRFAIAAKRMICVSEVQALDAIRYEPFDLQIALPDERTPDSGQVAQVLTPSGRPVPGALAARNAAEPAGEPVLEDPTLHSLGAYWIIVGDENRNARVAVRYRETGTGDWLAGAPLFRVERGAHLDEKGQSTLSVPEEAWLFAGSLLMLQPGTEYEWELSLSDPDGGAAQRVLRARTNAEPIAAADMRVRHVTPGNGGGAGTEGDPFLGLAAAQATAEPGDLFVVHAGVYGGTFTVDRSGEPGRPIVWRGEEGAIIDAQGQAAERPGRVVSAGGVHDVWFEDLTLRNGDYGLVAHNSARIVVRGCHIHGVEYGLTCTNNSADVVRGFFIADNLIEGPSTWPRTKGIENARGIQITGSGHDVCHNRIRGFADAVDTFPSIRCAAIDIHHNDISEMTDDGIEMDYSERNTRCFGNRLTNVFQGISEQPVFGGPVYILRNVLYNVQEETFKLHNSPSGALLFHNTSVKSGMPLVLMTNEPVRNCVSRNNLFIGTTANYAYESTAPMVECDFDYDGFGGGPWGKFLKWNGARYGSLDEVLQSALVYHHAVLVDPSTLFASGVQPPASFEAQVTPPPDLRLAAGTAAIDAGEPLPGVNDGFAGAAPDLGAHELGAAPPHYGPR